MNYFAIEPQELMAQHGKTFYFASRFFSRPQMDRIATLYAICRYVDDCADELPPNESRVALTAIKATLGSGPSETPAVFETVVAKVETYGVQRGHLSELVRGAEFDLNQESIETEEDLERYCYWVAGVVGLMMCPLLGTADNKAHSHAVDLGIGMQLTNICRDVLQDAMNGRTYLPGVRLRETGLTLAKLARQGPAPQALKGLVKEYLDLADVYYERAYRGLGYLPFRSRLCILLAGEVYRHIGVRIRKRHYEVQLGRTYLPLPVKIWVAVKSLRHLTRRSFWRAPSPA